MKRFPGNIFLLIFVFNFLSSFSQTCDSSNFSSQLKTSEELSVNKPDSALKIALAALGKAKNCDNKQMLMKAFYLVGSAYDYLSQVDSAMECYKMYLFYATQIKDSSSIARAYNMVGSIYIYKADYNKALNLCLTGLKIAERIKDDRVTSSCIGNIGNICYYQRHYEEALSYWLRGLEIAKKLKNVKNVIILLGNVGAYYNEKEDFENAIKYLNESLAYTLQENDKHGALAAMINLGNAYMYAGKYEMALQYNSKALALAEEVNDYYNQIIVSNNTGDIYTKLRRYKDAERQFLHALVIERKFPYPQGRLASDYGLFMVNDSIGNYKTSIAYLLKYKDLKDSVLNEESQAQLNEFQTKYQSEKKEQENKLLTAKNTLSEQTIKNQRNITVFLVIGILLALILFVSVYRSFRQKKKDNLVILSQKQEVELRNAIIENQKAMVEEKQKEIIDSIHYARRIQQALLANENYIQKTLKRLLEKMK